MISPRKKEVKAAFPAKAVLVVLWLIIVLLTDLNFDLIPIYLIAITGVCSPTTLFLLGATKDLIYMLPLGFTPLNYLAITLFARFKVEKLNINFLSLNISFVFSIILSIIISSQISFLCGIPIKPQLSSSFISAIVVVFIVAFFKGHMQLLIK